MRPERFIVSLCIILFGMSTLDAKYSNPNEVNSIVIDSIYKTEEVCALSNGTVTIYASDNTGSVLYYSIDGGNNYQTSNYFDGLPSNDYLIFISDGNGCSLDFSTQIVSAPYPEVHVAFECVEGKNEVDIDLEPFEGGISPFNYQWSGPNNSTFNTEDLFNVAPGDYSVTITDRLGCQIDTTLFVPICCKMKVSCTVDSLFYTCLSEVPAIDDNFTNNDSDDGADRALIEELNFLVSDPCSPVFVNVTDQNNNPSSCEEDELIINRMYQINDGTSSASCMQVIAVDNFSGITITKEAEDLSISCEEDVVSILNDWINDLGGAQYKLCNADISINSYPPLAEVLYSCEGTGGVELNFVIEDGCGHIAETSARFSVQDITPPEIVCPETITVSNTDFSSNGVPEDWANSLFTEDNCSGTEVRFDEDVLSNFVDCEPSNIDVKFYSVDDCGNESSCITSIIVNSTLIPEIECPPSIIINCGEAVDNPSIQLWLDNTNVSGTNNVAYTPEHDLDIYDLADLTCGESIDVVFSLYDICGQDVSCNSMIQVQDTIAPEINCPVEATLSFNDLDFENKIQAWLNSASSTDNCTSADLANSFSEDYEFLVCEQTDLIDFLATDECGNKNECFTFLTVTKDHSIDIVCPGEASFSLGDDDLESAIYDHLNNLEIESDLEYELEHNFDFQDLDLESAEIYSVDINFIATDFCGNTIDCNSTIQLIPIARVYIPNVFTPDTDDLNDYFTAFTNESVVQIKTMLIYNRWGGKVFEKYDFPANNSSEAWNGTYLDQDEENHLFTYYIVVEDLMGNELEYSGSVQLLR